MAAVRFFIADKDIDYPFVIETLDLSEQQNMVIHTMGDAYKVSSYGARVMERAITGTIPNPAHDLIPLLRFYDTISIRNNYGIPIRLIAGSHIAYGQIVGMTITLQEGTAGNITLNFLDMGSDVDVNNLYAYIINPRHNIYQPLDRDHTGYIQFSLARDISDNGESIQLHSLTNAVISMSSKYQLIDSRKNIVYYSENPVQIYGDGIITIENALLGHEGELITPDDRIKVGTKRRRIIEKIRITKAEEGIEYANMKITQIGNNSQFMAIPIEVMSIQAADIADQINYMRLTFNGVGFYEDFIPSLSLAEDGGNE